MLEERTLFPNWNSFTFRILIIRLGFNETSWSFFVARNVELKIYNDLKEILVHFKKKSLDEFFEPSNDEYYTKGQGIYLDIKFLQFAYIKSHNTNPKKLSLTMAEKS